MLGIIDSTLDIPYNGLELFWDAGQLRSFVSGTQTLYNLDENQNYSASFFSGSGGFFPTYSTNGGGSIFIPQRVFPAPGFESAQFTGSTSAQTVLAFVSRNGAQYADVSMLNVNGGLGVAYFAANNSPEIFWAGGLFRDNTLPAMTTGIFYMVGGSGTSNSQKIYLNKTVSNFTLSRTVPVNYTKVFSGTALGGGLGFTGNVAIGLVYNRQLSDTEVFQIYDFFKPRFPDLP